MLTLAFKLGVHQGMANNMSTLEDVLSERIARLAKKLSSPLTNKKTKPDLKKEHDGWVNVLKAYRLHKYGEEKTEVE